MAQKIYSCRKSFISQIPSQNNSAMNFADYQLISKATATYPSDHATGATTIKVYPHHWPEPICDRPPTAKDGDHEGVVQYLNHEGRWANGSWEQVASNFGKCPWLHCPQWRLDWSDSHSLTRAVPLAPAPTHACPHWDRSGSGDGR